MTNYCIFRVRNHLNCNICYISCLYAIECNIIILVIIDKICEHNRQIKVIGIADHENNNAQVYEHNGVTTMGYFLCTYTYSHIAIHRLLQWMELMHEWQWYTVQLEIMQEYNLMKIASKLCFTNMTDFKIWWNDIS